MSNRGWNFCISITQKSIAQFLPRLDLASYLCCLYSFLTTKRHPSNVEPSYILIFRSIQSEVYPVGRSTDRSLFTQIIIYNYKDLGWIFTKFGTYICLWLSCTCAKFQLDRSMDSWVRVIFVFVRKEKKRRAKTKTLVTRISELAGAIYFNFGM